MRTGILVLAMVASLGTVGAIAHTQQPDEPKIFKPKLVAPGPTRWEYRVEDLVRSKLQVELNKLGAEGWELVAVEPPALNGMPSTYIFRRPVASMQKPAAKPAPEPAPKDK